MKTTMLPEDPDTKSLAGADVRFMMDGETGDMIHCTVPPHQVNKAIVHALVSEFWYVLEGHGEIWRDDGVESGITALVPGTSIDIPVGTAFQYRNVSDVDLKFICIAMPPWPGDSEATYVKGKWQPTGNALRPARQSVELLAAIMEAAWTHILSWIEGLTDDEFFWEPVPNCWTVHLDGSGRWQVAYALPEPDPSPFTTIGWRLVHIASCKIMYHEYAFGPGQLTWDELPVPHTAAKATAWLEEGQHLLQGDLQRLDDASLEKMVLTNWGNMWPTWRIFQTMIQHDLHYGAEIGCLRDLYRAMHPV